MPLPQLTVYRQDRGIRALITLSGEIDLESVPLVRACLERCLRDGIRAIDVDLISVTFCDCTGLNAFLRAAQQATVVGGTLRLHHPPPTLARILHLVGCGFLLLGLPFEHVPPSSRGHPGHARSSPAARSCPACACSLGRCAMTAEPGRGQSGKPAEGDPCAMAPVRLRRLNRWLVEGLREELADLYVESRVTAPGDAYRRPGRQNFLARLTTDMRRPGFAMVIGEMDRLMGCAFGFPVRGDGSWWFDFEGALPCRIDQLTVSGGVFAFDDIMIRPHPQDRGLARRLLERLLTDHQASLGATLVDRADRSTLAALRSWGWTDVGELRRPAGPTTFRALVFPVGERTGARVDGLVVTRGGGGPGGA